MSTLYRKYHRYSNFLAKSEVKHPQFEIPNEAPEPHTKTRSSVSCHKQSFTYVEFNILHLTQIGFFEGVHHQKIPFSTKRHRD